jgi:hypothetical protein
MSATSIWPHWTVTRAIAMLEAGGENIDLGQLASALECDLEEAQDVLDEALQYRTLGGCWLYSRDRAH